MPRFLVRGGYSRCRFASGVDVVGEPDSHLLRVPFLRRTVFQPSVTKLCVTVQRPFKYPTNQGVMLGGWAVARLGK